MLLLITNTNTFSLIGPPLTVFLALSVFIASKSGQRVHSSSKRGAA